MKTASLEILEKAELPPAQSHAILKVMESEMASLRDTLATKADLDLGSLALRTDISGGLSAVRGELQEGLGSVRGELREGLAVMRGELQEGLAAMRAELREGLTAMRAELREGLGAMRIELHDGLSAARAETLTLKAETLGIEGKLTRWVLTCILSQTAFLAGFGYFLLEHWRK